MKTNVKELFLKFLDLLIPIAGLAAIAIAGFYLYGVYHERSVASNEYAKVQEAAGVDELPEDMDESEPIDDNQADMEAYRQTFKNLHVNFKALEEINGDVIGWLYIPTLKISYPVLQSTDNDYYLHHTIEGTENSAGSIFMDAECNPDMNDFNTFFYGHAMKNRSMFGSLKDLLSKPELIDADPFVYYYTKDHAYKYRIVSTYITRQGSDAYAISENREQFYNYMVRVSKWNTYKNGLVPVEDDGNYGNVDWDNVTAEQLDNIDKILSFSDIYKLGTGEEVDIDKIITLSTCSGSGTGQRRIIQAYLYDEYKILYME